MVLRKLVEKAQELEFAKEREHFYVTDASECPRKVLLRRMGATEAPVSSRIIFRRIAGHAMERALEPYLAAFAKENSRHIGEVVRERMKEEDLEWALRNGIPQVHPAFIPQFPFRRFRDGIEVRGRVDYLLLHQDELRILEIKQTHFEGEREVVRKGKPFPSFIIQASFYSQELSLPLSLLVFTVNGGAREFQVEGNSVDGREITLGGLPPSEFAWKRFAFLREATLAQFPIEKEGQILYVSLPENFPTHPEDSYRLVLNKNGKPRREASIRGRKEKSFRCPSCPFRLLCFPDLPWDGKEDL